MRIYLLKLLNWM